MLLLSSRPAFWWICAGFARISSSDLSLSLQPREACALLRRGAARSGVVRGRWSAVPPPVENCSCVLYTAFDWVVLCIYMSTEFTSSVADYFVSGTCGRAGEDGSTEHGGLQGRRVRLGILCVISAMAIIPELEVVKENSKLHCGYTNGPAGSVFRGTIHSTYFSVD